MAEPRRVQLKAVCYDVPLSTRPELQMSLPCVAPGKRNHPDAPGKTESTVRCTVSLFETDESAFPEFSYAQLVDNKSRRMLVKDGSPPSTFEGEENGKHDVAAAIARKLEGKYGGKTKRKKDRVQDLVDIGDGYDEEDSFIDNSEPYDEFVPASITTKYGGFYINSGLLQYRQASETDTEDFATERKTLEPSKKRKLNGQDKPKKCKEVGQMKPTEDSETGTLSEIGAPEQIKKRKPVRTLSVTNMLKKFQREKDREIRKRKKENLVPIISTPTLPLCPADAAGDGDSGLADPLLSLIGSMNDHALIQAASTVDFYIDLDSLLDDTEENSLPKTLLQPSEETQLILPSQPQTNVQTQSTISSQAQFQPPISETKTSAQPKPHPEQTQVLSEAKTTPLQQCVPLPEGLPPVLERRIEEFMVAAKTSEGESKLKFFTPEINSLLLDIELQCREQGGQLRSKVYTHLSSFLPCSRDTLLKRVKKLLIAHMDPMQKLKEAIDRVMPEQIACFHDNYQAHVQVKSTKATEEGKEGKLKGIVASEDNLLERSGKRGPTKLFRWSEETRSAIKIAHLSEIGSQGQQCRQRSPDFLSPGHLHYLWLGDPETWSTCCLECLCHVVKAKMDRYDMERNGNQEMEEYLKIFLVNEVKQLWPKGWMQPRVLLRESRKIVGPLTSLRVKTKSEKKPSVNGPAIPSSGSSPADSCGTPPLKEPSLERDGALDEHLISNTLPLCAVEKEIDALKMVEDKCGDWLGVFVCAPTLVETEKQPLFNTTAAPAAPTQSLLDLLAEQALAREQLVMASISQQLLAAALASAKCKQSVQHRSLGVDIKSSPVPPLSTSVGSPGNGDCCRVLPAVLQVAGFTKGDATKMPAKSEDAVITIP